jgi:hypothetical protein
MKFKVGDKVKTSLGTGKIVAIEYGSYAPYFVYMGKDFDGHSGHDPYRQNNEHNWWFREDMLELIEEEKKEMNLKETLKQGAIVKTREGNLYILIGEKFVNLKYGSYVGFSSYDNNLIHNIGYKEMDIINFFIPSSDYEGYNLFINHENIPWTWERKEAKEMTVAEISKALGYEVKVVKE